MHLSATWQFWPFPKAMGFTNFTKNFNRNNIKVSYSCMPNTESAINSHNRKILHPPVNNQSRTCNCINKTDCPLQEKCLSKNTLYQADISSENFQTKIYYNILETKFKTRHSNHKKSFNHAKQKKWHTFIEWTLEN